METSPSSSRSNWCWGYAIRRGWSGYVFHKLSSAERSSQGERFNIVLWLLNKHNSRRKRRFLVFTTRSGLGVRLSTFPVDLIEHYLILYRPNSYRSQAGENFRKNHPNTKRCRGYACLRANQTCGHHRTHWWCSNRWSCKCYPSSRTQTRWRLTSPERCRDPVFADRQWRRSRSRVDGPVSGPCSRKLAVPPTCCRIWVWF